MARKGAVRIPPKPLAKPDFTELTRLIQEGVERSADEQYADADFDHEVYEAAIEAVYGPDFWNWWNQYNDWDEIKDEHSAESPAVIVPNCLVVVWLCAPCRDRVRGENREELTIGGVGPRQCPVCDVTEDILKMHPIHMSTSEIMAAREA